MAVTEIALLSTSLDLDILLDSLHDAKKTLAQASGDDFYFLVQQGVSYDEAGQKHILILGTWQSLAAHEAFLPSDENQRLLKLLKGKVSVEWLTHGRFELRGQRVETVWVFKGDSDREFLSALDDLQGGDSSARVLARTTEEGGAAGLVFLSGADDIPGKLALMAGRDFRSRFVGRFDLIDFGPA